jgi:hypothetical protein
VLTLQPRGSGKVTLACSSVYTLDVGQQRRQPLGRLDIGGGAHVDDRRLLVEHPLVWVGGRGRQVVGKPQHRCQRLIAIGSGARQAD